MVAVDTYHSNVDNAVALQFNANFLDNNAEIKMRSLDQNCTIIKRNQVYFSLLMFVHLRRLSIRATLVFRE